MTLRGLSPCLQCDDCFRVPFVATLQVTEAQSGVHSPLTAAGVEGDPESSAVALPKHSQAGFPEAANRLSLAFASPVD
jgi:hypothetical protein